MAPGTGRPVLKLLLDEQISGKVAERLRNRGHDVNAVVTDSELCGLSDSAIFNFAQGERRALATYNYLDFIEIARQHSARGQDHHGLIVVHPTKLPSWELTRLTNELDRFLNEFTPHASLYAWIPLSYPPKGT